MCYDLLSKSCSPYCVKLTLRFPATLLESVHLGTIICNTKKLNEALKKSRSEKKFIIWPRGELSLRKIVMPSSFFVSGFHLHLAGSSLSNWFMLTNKKGANFSIKWLPPVINITTNKTRCTTLFFTDSKVGLKRKKHNLYRLWFEISIELLRVELLGSTCYADTC